MCYAYVVPGQEVLCEYSVNSLLTSKRHTVETHNLFCINTITVCVQYNKEITNITSVMNRIDEQLIGWTVSMVKSDD